MIVGGHTNMNKMTKSYYNAMWKSLRAIIISLVAEINEELEKEDKLDVNFSLDDSVRLPVYRVEIEKENDNNYYRLCSIVYAYEHQEEDSIEFLMNEDYKIYNGMKELMNILDNYLNEHRKGEKK